jgi:outer membrane protein assembly factor BamB
VAVEQNRIKRAGTGLRAYDRARAWPGYTLFAPNTIDNRTVYLIDIEGNACHRWEMPYAPGLYGYLTESGTLFYNGKVPDESFIGRAPFGGGVCLEVDWNGQVMWEVRHTGHHHDGSLLRNGNIVLLGARELTASFAKRVLGGRAGSEEDGKIYADYIVEVTRRGEMVWEWRTWEHLDPETYPIACPQDSRQEWTHANSVSELPDGNLLVSFRQTSTVIVIDRGSGDVIWKLGAPPLSGQHAPTPLPNGNILIFDNGPHRLDESLPYSRVIEIDPSTQEIVWKYQEDPVIQFFSPRISSAQRLPNGNTLICEGSFGRLFEVTHEGQVVWEYVNPYFGKNQSGAEVNTVFRAYRYDDEAIARARSAV